MVKFVTGDLFTYPGLDAIAHGCNCAGVMGAGIAKEFKKRFPGNYEYYKAACTDGSFRPGIVLSYKAFNKYILNLATQDEFINPATLDVVKECLWQMLDVVNMSNACGYSNIKTIGLPRIGAGLGGLDWDEVKQVILELDTEGLELIVFEEWK